MTFVRIGLWRSGKPLRKNALMLGAKDLLALQALRFPLHHRLLLVRGLLWKPRTLRLLLLPPSLQKGGVRRGGLRVHLVLLPVVLPLLPLAMLRARGVEVCLVALPVHASALLSPLPLWGLGIQERLARGGPLCAPPCLQSALPAHHCTLREVVSRERLRKPAPVLVPPLLPGLRAEKHGRTLGLALVTGLVARTLAPLPVHDQEVRSAVGGAHLSRLLPVNGLGGTGRGLRTATGLVAFASARFPAVTGRGVSLLTDTGHGASVRGPLFAREVVVTGCGLAIPVAILVTVRGRMTGPFFPLTVRGHGEEAGEPGVSCGRVWRRLLSPRLPLSLERRRQWLLLLQWLLLRHFCLLFRTSPGFS